VRGSAAYRNIVLALFCSGFATFSLLYCVQPLLPAFAREFHIGAASASLALSLSTGFLAVSILLAGMVSERYGRKELMFASLATAACCNLLAGVAPNWEMILVARALEGMALGGVPAVAMAYLAEEIDAGGLGYAMGLYVGGNAFGGMVGRVAMSTLSEHIGWRHAMLAIGALDLALAVAFVMMLPASRNFVRNGTMQLRDHLALWRRHLGHARLPLTFGIAALNMGIFATSYNYAGFRLMSPPFSLGHAHRADLQRLHLRHRVFFMGRLAGRPLWTRTAGGRGHRHLVRRTVPDLHLLAGAGDHGYRAADHRLLHHPFGCQQLGRAHGQQWPRPCGLALPAVLLPGRQRPRFGRRLVLGTFRLECGGGLHAVAGGDGGLAGAVLVAAGAQLT
jgi:MFS family permease